MSDQNHDDSKSNHSNQEVQFGSLEHSDMGESMKQLWWTIGVTVAGLALIAYFSL